MVKEIIIKIKKKKLIDYLTKATSIFFKTYINNIMEEESYTNERKLFDCGIIYETFLNPLIPLKIKQNLISPLNLIIDQDYGIN